MRNMAAVAKSVELDENGLLWSFLAGMLSHIAVDVVFHPLVYYLTGDFDHKDRTQQRQARARHCVFEVYLIIGGTAMGLNFGIQIEFHACSMSLVPILIRFVGLPVKAWKRSMRSLLAQATGRQA